MSILKIYQGRALQAALAEIVRPVQVNYFALDQPESATVQAVADLIKLTPYLSVNTQQEPAAEADRIIIRDAEGRELVFVGPPVGNELAALVSAIIVAGRGKSGLLPATRRALTNIHRPMHLAVFTTPT
jgi:alkyl hydroperoxide reductase subunit AhpF